MKQSKAKLYQELVAKMNERADNPWSEENDMLSREIDRYLAIDHTITIDDLLEFSKPIHENSKVLSYLSLS